MRQIFSFRTLWFVVAVVAMSAAMSSTSAAQVIISVRFGPPALPVYDQPICPGEGYIWTPGYWAWDDDGDDYYWVPGTWVLAPRVGYLWTPPWWGWSNGVYVFHEGWWGPHVGFYGGVVYGFGYFGDGYDGGRWEHDRFYYNRSVTNVNVVNIHNVYNETVIHNNVTVNRVSYNGGPGGIQARPRPEQERYDRERHLPPATPQREHQQFARGNQELRATTNHGRPPIAATGRPGDFRGGAVPAREAGGTYERPPVRQGGPQRGVNDNFRPAHAGEMRPFQRPAPPNTGNANRDRKYQQQQDRMFAKQEQDRQRLQQKQEQDHQRLTQRNAPEPRRQQTEQRHQQQTQQLQQRHEQQVQHLQQRQQQPPKHQ